MHSHIISSIIALPNLAAFKKLSDELLREVLTMSYRTVSQAGHAPTGHASVAHRPSALFIRAACLAVGLVALAAVPLHSAEAKIKCNGIFQQTKNGPIATPYCSEQEIARVARSYGEKVTDAEVHNNALTKVRLCQRFGNDNRLKGACGAYNLRNYR